MDTPEQGREICPVCTSGRNSRLFHIGAGETLRLCGRCGARFLEHQQQRPDSAVAYGRPYYDSWGWANEEKRPLVTAMKRRTFDGYLRRMAPHARTGTLLDVGCAFGALMQQARRLGWDPYGVEISPFSAREAQRLFGERVRLGSFETASLPPSFFSVVVMSDVLEHAAAPRVMLNRANQVLVRGGILLIVTPNAESLSARVMGRRWTHYKQEHPCVFSPFSLLCLLEEFGFKVLARRPATKYLTLDYLNEQFERYKHPALTPVVSLLAALLPPSFRRVPFPFFEGDMLVLGKKERAISNATAVTASELS